MARPRLRLAGTITALAALTLALTESSRPMRAEVIASVAAGETAPLIPPAPGEPQRLFISGHSLTDRPYPQYLAAIAASQGKPVQWNVQNQFGSTLRQRTEGSASHPWSGYYLGTDRDGRPIDVLSELARPQATDGAAYDTLIITEQHTLLGNLIWNDTPRFLRDFHDRMVETNPAAQTFLFESWLGPIDLDKPERWVSYERAASPVWACIAGGINRSLAEQERVDRIRPLPAALALATLVEKATGGKGMPGVSEASTAATMKRLFADDVHLTETGSYYIALVSYAFLYRQPPLMAWFPDGIRPATAKALQREAWAFTVQYLKNFRASEPDQCSRYVRENFVPLYLDYLRDLQRARDGSLRHWWQWARFRLEWPRLFRRNSPSNPLEPTRF